MATVYSLICWGGLSGKTVSIAASTDVVTLTNHGLRNGTKLWPSGTLPSELNTSTPVYARSTGANTFTLHTSAAGAIANTGQILFAGSSTYAAVTLKSDLVASPSTALSAYGLSDLSRWGSLIFDGLANWRASRFPNAQPYDSEYCEIGEAFDDIATTTLILNVPAAEVIVWTKINGAYTPGWHGGVVGSGYRFFPTAGYTAGINISGIRQKIRDFSVHTTYQNIEQVYLSGTFCEVESIIATGPGNNTGFKAIASASKITKCIATGGLGGGFVFQGYGNAACIFANNLATKCTTGFLGSPSECRGFYYNNVAVGNTTNWGTSPVIAYATCAYNGGISTNTPWFTGTDTGIKTLTADNTTFKDYAGNDFRHAGDSVAHTTTSAAVDSGIRVLDIPEYDMLGNVRPDYKNGSATGWDLGPFEFDWGYAIPTMDYRGLAFSGILAGSTVKVFESGTTTELFSTTSSGTSETWSENASGSRTVDYTILKDGYMPIRVAGVTVTGALSGGIVSTPVQQVVSRSWATPSGLTFGTTATVDVATKRVTVTTATTGQNWFNFMVQCWRTESSLKNVQFPFSENGPNSFQLADGWQFSSGINYLSRDGIRYVNSSGVVTDVWAAILSIGVPAGMTVRYKHTDGGAAQSAANTGNIDQLVKVYENGLFDYTGFLPLKVQGDGYDQAEFDAVATYGTLEDQLYVVGLTPAANGIAAGMVTGVTITDHGASPVTWNSKQFSITITDTGVHTGKQILQYVRGLNNFNYHDLVQTNGTSFKTMRGSVYGDIGASMKGVRVVKADGTTSHPDFNLHTSDDGTTYAPPLPPAAVSATILADSRVQLYNVTTDTEIDNVFVTGTGYSYTITTEASLGDTIRLRVCKLGREAGEAFGIWAGNPMPMLISQPENEIYTAWGIDGSNVPEFSGDVTGHIYIDANDLDGVTTKTRLGAWYSWVLTTEIGIRHFYGAISYVAANAIRVNVEIVDILIENINATTTLVFTDLDVRLYRSDGSSIIAPTSYSIHNDYSGVPDVSVVTVSGSNVITGDITDVAPAVWSHGTRTLTTSSGGSSADDVWNHNKALTVGKFLGLK